MASRIPEISPAQCVRNLPGPYPTRRFTPPHPHFPPMYTKTIRLHPKNPKPPTETNNLPAIRILGAILEKNATGCVHAIANSIRSFVQAPRAPLVPAASVGVAPVSSQFCPRMQPFSQGTARDGVRLRPANVPARSRGRRLQSRGPGGQRAAA